MRQWIDRGRAPLAEAEMRAVARWVEDDGEPAVLQEMGISRLALARCIGGMTVLAGTRALVRAALARKGVLACTL